MGNHEHLTVGEFERAMKALDRALTAGFDRTETRFDRIEGTQNEHIERIVALEQAPKRSTRRVAAWSSVIAAVVTGAIEGVRRAFGG